jgi:DNA-binding transcriptional LysR family regulator
MNYKQVEAFRAVMLTGSMTTAAAQLYTSQPNVSRLVGQLERDTGLQLFKRMAGRLLPTPEAEALFREVERSFVGLQGLREAALSIRRLGTGTLRIGTVSSIAIGLLPTALSAFRRQHPDVPVAVHISDSPTVCKWTAAGFCDLGLVAYLVDTPGVEARIWHRERGVCVVPDDHRLASRRRIRAGDLDGEPFISLPPGDGTRAAIDAAFQPDRRLLTIETSFAPAICTMVGKGLGVSIVNPLVSRSLQIPGIKEIPFEPAIEFVSYSLRPQQRVEQAMATEFFRCIESAM